MILFTEVFKRAVNLFDDPDIRQNYYLDPVSFQKQMLPFLLNGKDTITSPTILADELVSVSDPQGFQEEFEGTGEKTYHLSTEPIDGSAFSYKINGKSTSGLYNKETNEVTFSQAVKEGDKCTVTWFYAGAFTSEFNVGLRGDFPREVFLERLKEILAHKTLETWAEQEMNRALEFRNILSDADMTFYSPANSLKEKRNWYKNLQAETDTLLSELNWRIFATPNGGSNFGK